MDDVLDPALTFSDKIRIGREQGSLARIIYSASPIRSSDECSKLVA